MKRLITGMNCISCKERFYKDSFVRDDELKIDKLDRAKVHVVKDMPKYCSRCGGHLRPIKKYIPRKSRE